MFNSRSEPSHRAEYIRRPVPTRLFSCRQIPRIDRWRGTSDLPRHTYITTVAASQGQSRRPMAFAAPPRHCDCLGLHRSPGGIRLDAVAGTNNVRRCTLSSVNRTGLTVARLYVDSPAPSEVTLPHALERCASYRTLELGWSIQVGSCVPVTTQQPGTVF